MKLSVFGRSHPSTRPPGWGAARFARLAKLERSSRLAVNTVHEMHRARPYKA